MTNMSDEMGLPPTGGGGEGEAPGGESGEVRDIFDRFLKLEIPGSDAKHKNEISRQATQDEGCE